MNQRNEPLFGARSTAGITAGIIAGLVMAIVAMGRAAYTGMSIWLPPQQIAATFFGVEALLGGFGVTVVGLLIHVIVSGFLGWIFSLFAGRWSASGAFLAGLGWGVVIWLAMTFAALPWINEVMSERVALAGAWWFFYHLIFGAMLVLTPFLTSRFESRPRHEAVHAGHRRPA